MTSLSGDGAEGVPKKGHRMDPMQSRWESAVSMKPSDPQILCGFATYLAKAGEYERAQEVYTRSLASDGTHLGSLCNYAVMLEARGNEEEACELYKRAIEADGGQVIALSNYGHLLCRNGHLDRAEEIFKQGLKHHPSDVMLLHNYGCLLWEGRGEYSRAEGMLEKALKIDPQHGATVQALDDLKADKLDARRRADEIAAELLAQVEGEKGGKKKKAKKGKKDKARQEKSPLLQPEKPGRTGAVPHGLRIDLLETNTLHVTFDLDDGATATHCQAQWDGVPLRQQVLSAGVNLCTVTHPSRLPGGTHSLRICVRSGGRDTYGPWSSVLEVEIEKPPPPQPALRNKSDRKIKKLTRASTLGQEHYQGCAPFDCGGGSPMYDARAMSDARAVKWHSSTEAGPADVGTPSRTISEEGGAEVRRTSSAGQFINIGVELPCTPVAQAGVPEGAHTSFSSTNCSNTSSPTNTQEGAGEITLGRCVSWADAYGGSGRLVEGIEKIAGMIGDAPSPMISFRGGDDSDGISESAGGKKRSVGGGAQAKPPPLPSKAPRSPSHYWMGMEDDAADDEKTEEQPAAKTFLWSCPSTVKIASFSMPASAITNEPSNEGRPPKPPSKAKKIFESSSSSDDELSSSCSEPEKDDRPPHLPRINVSASRKRTLSSSWLTLSFAVEQNGHVSVASTQAHPHSPSFPAGPLPSNPSFPSGPLPSNPAPQATGGASPRLSSTAPPSSMANYGKTPVDAESSKSSASSSSSSLPRPNPIASFLSAASTPPRPNPMASYSSSADVPKPNPMADCSSSGPAKPNPMASYSSSDPSKPNPMANYSSSGAAKPNPMASYSSSAPPRLNPMATFSSSGTANRMVNYSSSSSSSAVSRKSNPMATFSSSNQMANYTSAPPRPNSTTSNSNPASAPAAATEGMSPPSASDAPTSPSGPKSANTSSTATTGQVKKTLPTHSSSVSGQMQAAAASGGKPTSGGADEEDECVICFEGGKSHALIPCGHLAMCATCSLMVGKDTQIKVCPVCNTAVVEPFVVRVFRS